MKPAKRKKPKMEFTVCCRLTPEEFEEIIDKFYQLQTESRKSNKADFSNHQ